MSGNYNWYKREPKKFIGGVIGLGPALIGCYSVVLDLIYEHEGACPNDPAWIGGILGCKGQQAAALIRGLITRGKLALDEQGRLVNAKASSVIAERSQTPSKPKVNAEQAPRKPLANEGASNKNSDLMPTEENRTEKNRADKKRKKKVSATVGDAKASSGGGGDPPSQAVVVAEPTEIDLAVAAYNDAAELCPGGHGAGWAKCQNLTANREKALRARLTEVGLWKWRDAMDRAARSDFLSGRAKRSPGHERWGVDIGWLAKAENFAKLTEGKYDNDRGRPQARGQDSARAGLMEFMRDEEETES